MTKCDYRTVGGVEVDVFIFNEDNKGTLYWKDGTYLEDVTLGPITDINGKEISTAKKYTWTEKGTNNKKYGIII